MVWGLIVQLVELAVQFILYTPMTTLLPGGVIVLGVLIFWRSWVSRKDLEQLGKEEAKRVTENRAFGIGVGSILLIAGLLCWFTCR
jgi:hypothetical protein